MGYIQLMLSTVDSIKLFPMACIQLMLSTVESITLFLWLVIN